MSDTDAGKYAATHKGNLMDHHPPDPLHQAMPLARTFDMRVVRQGADECVIAARDELHVDRRISSNHGAIACPLSRDAHLLGVARR